MPIGKVWIYRLLFVFFVRTVKDFSAEDKASGVKFCTAVHWPPRQLGSLPFLGRLFDRVDLLKPVSNVRPSIRA